jgi:hypothetical protein
MKRLLVTLATATPTVIVRLRRACQYRGESQTDSRRAQIAKPFKAKTRVSPA